MGPRGRRHLPGAGAVPPRRRAAVHAPGPPGARPAPAAAAPAAGGAGPAGALRGRPHPPRRQVLQPHAAVRLRPGASVPVPGAARRLLPARPGGGPRGVQAHRAGGPPQRGVRGGPRGALHLRRHPALDGPRAPGAPPPPPRRRRGGGGGGPRGRPACAGAGAELLGRRREERRVQLRHLGVGARLLPLLRPVPGAVRGAGGPARPAVGGQRPAGQLAAARV
mmetsp:Transcript_9977/g.28051  ORF Transcript_9977/g.28051 Transcript_9977/m.28051 type:complete len:222 (-) Transcript_9977:1073-1738(-)